MAQLRSEPHWLINDDDAKRYGQAMANAARHFPLKATQKAIDCGAFIMAAFVIESPRIIRSAQLARQPRQPPRGNPYAGTAQVYYPFAANPIPTPSPSPSPPPPAAAVSPNDGAGLPPIAEGPPDPTAFGGEGA